MPGKHTRMPYPDTLLPQRLTGLQPCLRIVSQNTWGESGSYGRRPKRTVQDPSGEVLVFRCMWTRFRHEPRKRARGLFGGPDRFQKNGPVARFVAGFFQEIALCSVTCLASPVCALAVVCSFSIRTRSGNRWYRPPSAPRSWFTLSELLT